MRERTYQVDRDKLALLSELHRSTEIAKKLNISKQLWHHYKVGNHDVPESVVDKICAEFSLSRDDLIQA
jgi:hypothetical protein